MRIYMKHFTDPVPSNWNWPNFTPEEMASNGNGEVHMSIATMDKFQELRDRWGEPIVLNSAYRDPAYNLKIGSTSGSQHPKGTAGDVRTRGWSYAKCRRFVELAYDVGFRGFGGYATGRKLPKFIHLDDRGSPAKWGKSWAWPKEYKK